MLSSASRRGAVCWLPRDADSAGEARSETEQHRRVPRLAGDEAHGRLHRGGIHRKSATFFRDLRETLLLPGIQLLTEPGQKVQLLVHVVDSAWHATLPCWSPLSRLIGLPLFGQHWSQGRQDARLTPRDVEQPRWDDCVGW